MADATTTTDAANGAAVPGATVMSTTVPLKFPDLLDKDGTIVKRIESVTIRRPRGKEMRALDAQGGKMAQTIALLSACSGLLPSDIDLMDGSDVMALVEVVTSFLGASPPTGGTS